MTPQAPASDRCARCGYVLHDAGAQSRPCPECGTPDAANAATLWSTIARAAIAPALLAGAVALSAPHNDRFMEGRYLVFVPLLAVASCGFAALRPCRTIGRALLHGLVAGATVLAIGCAGWITWAVVFFLTASI